MFGALDLVSFETLYVVNPVTPKSDQHLISPYNINPELHIKVTRIRKMITSQKKLLIFLNKFSLWTP